MKEHVAARRRCASAVGAGARDVHSAVLSGTPTVDAPAAAIRDEAELLDINMHQLARGCFLVADRLRAANRQAGGLIYMRQQRHPITAQDPPDRRAWHSEVIADPVRTPPAREPQRDDAVLQTLRSPGR